MANEISNRSAAGVCIEIVVGLADPILISSWGFRTDTLQKFAVGTYLIELTRPQSGVISLNGDFIEDADYVFLATYVLQPPPGFVTIQLTNPAVPPTTPAGTLIQLTHMVAITLDAAGDTSDAVGAIVSAEVRQVPTG